MIDLHSHIIFGLDDGAKNLDETLALAKNAVAAGVTHMMCTPHIHVGTFNNTSDIIYNAFEHCLVAIRQAKIPIKLSHSCEVRICPELLDWVSKDELYFLGMWENKSVLLLELPHSHIPAGTENVISWLHKNQIQVVIPHPERNREIWSNYAKARWLKRQGVLFQVTAGSFVGRFSSQVEDCAWTLHKDGFIDYIASDMHNLHKRPNDMKQAFEKISQHAGINEAERLFIDTPAEITRGIDWQ